jgi:hypothetical protein
MDRHDAAYELEDIREEILERLERAGKLIREVGTRVEVARAESYWLDIAKDVMGDEYGRTRRTMASMMGTIDELREEPEDEDE